MPVLSRPTVYRRDDIIRFAIDEDYELLKRTLHILNTRDVLTPEDEDVVRRAFRLLNQ